MNKYYVYFLINPINNTPFYVGKGSGRRAESHLRHSSNWRNNYVLDVLEMFNTEPKIVKIFCKSEREALELEEKCILLFGRKDIDPISKDHYFGNPVLNNFASNSLPLLDKEKKIIAKLHKLYNSSGYTNKKRSIRTHTPKITVKKFTVKYSYDEIFRLYITEKKSIQKICKELHAGVELVSNHIRYFGFHKPAGYNWSDLSKRKYRPLSKK